MKLSKRLRKWKANLTTQTPIDYVITLCEDVNGFADEVKALERENAKLREQGARLFDKTLELGTENAKLREMCSDMLAQLLNAYDPKELTEFFDRLHGIGIKVES